MHTAVLTSEQVQAFADDGVICLRKVLDPTLVAELGISLDALSASVAASANGYDLTDLRHQIFDGHDSVSARGAARQHNVSGLADFIRASKMPPLVDAPPSQTGEGGHFTLDTTTWKRSGVIRQIAFDTALPEITASLLCATKVNFCDDQIFVKTPYTAERTAFHQDLGYFHLSGTQGCIVWICADAANADAGVPLYLRGSHRWGVEYAPNVFVSQTALPGSTGQSLAAIEANPDDYDPVSFAVEPGDIIVHHFLTVHGAGGNRTARSRRALSLRYAGETVRYCKRIGAPDQPYHTHNLEDGDPLDSRQHPVVWPKPYPDFALADLYR